VFVDNFLKIQSMQTKTVAPGITRFDRDDRGGGGFMVRICRKGKRINEFFSDIRYGGKRNARKAADERYEELCNQLGPVQPSTKNKLTSRNDTGKVGVHIAHSIDNRYSNCEYSAYCASWVNENGKREKINFSWNKYGEHEAWELACYARDRELSDRDAVLKGYDRLQQARKKRTATKKKTATKRR
jgi:hypothetical protein